MHEVEDNDLKYYGTLLLIKELTGRSHLSYLVLALWQPS